MKKLNRKFVAGAIAVVIVVPLVTWWCLIHFGLVARPGQPLKPPFNLSDRIVTIHVEESEEGELVATFAGWDESNEPLDADEFYRILHERNRDVPRLFRILDVTSVTGLLWIVFGFAAQAVFAGRMIVQWWVSEKARQSVVPPIFWWMSLVGATMLMIYFIWRKEIVGFLGQCSGWFVYVRNLWFIYGRGQGKP